MGSRSEPRAVRDRSRSEVTLRHFADTHCAATNVSLAHALIFAQLGA